MKESNSKLNNLSFETIQRCFSQIKDKKLVKRYTDILKSKKNKTKKKYELKEADESTLHRKQNLELLSQRIMPFDGDSIRDYIEAYLFLSVGNDGRAYKILSRIIRKPLNQSILEANSESTSKKEYEYLEMIIEYLYTKLKTKFVDLVCAHLISVDLNIYEGNQVQSCSHLKRTDLSRFIYSPNFGKRYPSLWLNTPLRLSKKNQTLFFQQSVLYKKMKENDLSSWLVFEKYQIKSKKEKKLLKNFIETKGRKSNLLKDVIFRLSLSQNRYLLKQLGYDDIFSLSKRRTFYMDLLKDQKTYLYGIINLILLRDYSLNHINHEYL